MPRFFYNIRQRSPNCYHHDQYFSEDKPRQSRRVIVTKCKCENREVNGAALSYAYCAYIPFPKSQIILSKLFSLIDPRYEWSTKGNVNESDGPPCQSVIKISEPLQNGWAVLFCQHTSREGRLTRSCYPLVYLQVSQFSKCHQASF